MGTQRVVVRGEIRSDGTVEIEEKVNLPPGPVSVTLQTVPVTARKGTLDVLKEIWAQREGRGLVGRTKAEIDAEITAMRDEDEQ